MQYVDFSTGRDFDMILLGRVAVDFNPVDYNRPLWESTTFKKYVGGSPANIAVGLSRLGKKCGFFSRVSDDQLGTYVLKYFANEGIDTSHIFRCTRGEKIGLTFTEILSPEKSSILMYRNDIADLALEPGDVDEAYIKRAKALLISGTALAASPSREAALKALMLARKNGVRVFFDIDWRPYNWKSRDEVSVYYSIVAQNADVVLGSREEFDLMESLVAAKRSDEESADALFGHGVKIAVIKHGKEGSSAYTADGKKYSIKPFPVHALKGFGGGDGYASAFICGLLEGREMIECLEMGSAEAAMLVAAHSCSEAMPTADALREFIRKEKAEYGEMIARA